MKRWYVIQVYAGYEEAVRTDLFRQLQKEGLQDYFGDILIPTAQQKQLFTVSDQKDQQLFPGYMLIEMEMVPEAMRLVVSALRVIKFLGGTEPVPLAQKEIDRIILQIKGEIAIGVEREEFTLGNEVEIQDGPFSGFVGMIEKVDKESEKLTVMVSIFGRMTPVELGFQQVKR